MSERWLVRMAGVATFAVGVTVAVRASPLAPLPAWALSSRVVYALGVVLAVVAPVFVLLTLAVQTIVRGRVPTAISRDGMTWAGEVTATADAAIAKLELQISTVEADLDKIANRFLLWRDSRP